MIRDVRRTFTERAVQKYGMEKSILTESVSPCGVDTQRYPMPRATAVM